MKFKTATSRWLKYHKPLVKPSTFALYQYTTNKYILPYFNNSNVEDITNNVIQEFINDLLVNKDLDVKTIQNITINFKQIMNFCFEMNYTKQFYIKVRLPKRTNIKDVSIFNDNEIKKLKHFLINNPSALNVGILISIYSGLRIGEVCGLKWSDINFNTKTLSVKRTVQRIYYVHNNIKKSAISISEPKTISSIRTIPIHEELLVVLQKLQSDPNHFILSDNEEPKEPRFFRMHYAQILKDLHITFKKYHTLRHTFATNLITSGANPKIVSQLLGHAKVTTTLDLYVHPSLNNLKQAIQLI